MDNKRIIKEANRNKFLAGVLNESSDMPNGVERVYIDRDLSDYFDVPYAKNDGVETFINANTLKSKRNWDSDHLALFDKYAGHDLALIGDGFGWWKIDKALRESLEESEIQTEEPTREELDNIIKSKGYQPVWYRARRGEDYSTIVYIGRSTHKYPRGFKLGTKETDFRGFEKKSFEIILPEDVEFFIKKGFEKNPIPNTPGDFDISYKLHEGAEKIQIGSIFHVSSEGYTRSGYGSMHKGYKVVEDLGDDKYKCEVISDDTQTSVGNYEGSVGETDVFTKGQIIATDSLMPPEN